MRGEVGEEIVAHEVGMKRENSPDLLDVQDFLQQMRELGEYLRARLEAFEGKAVPSPEELVEREHVRFAYRMLCEEMSRYRTRRTA
jgi:hypothetical protein